MPESFGKTFYPALYSKLEKKKQAARNAPLTMADINTLLSMQFNNKPLFPSIELFHSDEYQQATIMAYPLPNSKKSNVSGNQTSMN